MTYIIEGHAIRENGNYLLIEDIDIADPKPDATLSCKYWSEKNDNGKEIGGKLWLRKDLVERYLGYSLESVIEESEDVTSSEIQKVVKNELAVELASINVPHIITSSISQAVKAEIQKSIIPSRKDLGYVDFYQLLDTKYSLTGKVKQYLTTECLNKGILGSVDWLVNPNELQEMIVKDDNLQMKFGRAKSKTKILFV